MGKSGIRLETLTTKNEGKFYKLSVIVFWGAIWGIIEASLGYFLHLFPLKFPTGSILFPIGFVCMQNVYRVTGSLKSIFYTSVIVATIKLINLLMPAVYTIKVLNPAGCILFEGLAVAAVYYIVQYNKGSLKFSYPVLMSIFWRIGYYAMCFGIFIPLEMMDTSSILAIDKFVKFFVINGLANAVIIYFISKYMAKKEQNTNINYSPIYSLTMLILAFMIQWVA